MVRVMFPPYNQMPANAEAFGKKKTLELGTGQVPGATRHGSAPVPGAMQACDLLAIARASEAMNILGRECPLHACSGVAAGLIFNYFMDYLER
jgi:hypothetical protein